MLNKTFRHISAYLLSISHIQAAVGTPDKGPRPYFRRGDMCSVGTHMRQHERSAFEMQAVYWKREFALL